MQANESKANILDKKVKILLVMIIVIAINNNNSKNIKKINHYY
jgi:hypothetical protein